MNYQDFESAWYLGLIVTSFVALALTGSWMIFKRLRELSRQQGALVSLLAGGAGAFTLLFLLGICLALLVGIVGLAGG